MGDLPQGSEVAGCKGQSAGASATHRRAPEWV
jgi:hypothetical protein